MSHITEEEIESELDFISKIKNKNERLAWKRKFDKLQQIIETELNPLDEKIIELVAEKNTILDSIVELRKVMTKECVHPKDWLVHKGNCILCKFCNVSLAIQKVDDE